MLALDKIKSIILIVGIILFIGVLLANSFFILKVWQVIRRHSCQIQAQQQSIQQSEQSINMPRYKKSVNTMYFVIGAFVSSYIPLLLAFVSYAFIKKRTQETSFFFVIGETLAMFNGVLNPIIYCWRITELRNATRQILQKIWRHITLFVMVTNDEP
jgi:hypothetical protein